jgi:subtilisin family serine protease
VFVIGCLLFGLIGFPGVATATPVSTLNSSESGSAHISDSSTLDVAANDTTEFIVAFEDIDAATLSDRPVRTLRSHAARSHKPLQEYVNSTPGVRIAKQFWITNAVLIETNRSRVLEQVTSLDGVERVHENYRIRTTATATPSLSPTGPEPATTSVAPPERTTYGLEQLSVPRVWRQFETNGTRATVAVLDSGVDTTSHSGLAEATSGWRDFVNGRSTPYDNNGHGTHVSGTVVGETIRTDGPLNGTAYGVAPGATLLHAKVSDSAGVASFDHLLAALEWAVAHEAGVDVVTISLGGDSYATDFIEPIRNAEAAGVPVVAAAGNIGPGTSTSPGNVYDSFSVGASTESETIALFSSGENILTADAWGSAAPRSWPDEYTVPDAVAPGNAVYSAYLDGGYATQSGTSMAAPHVAGTVALMESATGRELTPTEIERALTRTTWAPDDVTGLPDRRYGNGIINASAAVAAVATPPNFQLGALTASSSITQNTSYNVTAAVTNRGDTPGVGTVTYELRNATGAAVATRERTVDLGRNATTPITFEIPPAATDAAVGSHTHVVSSTNDTRAIGVEITEAYTLARYRTDSRVTPRDLGDAAADFRAGLIGPELLGDVAIAFRTS